jgi:hypothetical protein
MVNESDLNILEPVKFDNSIESYEYVTFKPFSPNMNNGDEIRLPINSKELITLPHRSFLYLSGRIDRHNTTTIHSMPYNGLMYLFSNISYELNGHLIDRTLNAGFTTTLKSYLSISPNNEKYYNSCGFNHSHSPYSSYTAASDGFFQVYIPFYMLMGFGEDYRKPIINSIQELILTRARDDTNVFLHAGRAQGVDNTHISAENPVVVLGEVSWKMPVIKLADYARVQLLNTIKDNRKIDIAFRTWDLYEYPTLPQTTSISWTIKTTHSLLKPRYVVVVFQTNRRNTYAGNVTLFDLIGLQTCRLFLNNMQFPQEEFFINTTYDQREILYQMFSLFQTSYYGKPFPEPIFTSQEFFGGNNPIPMVVFDCSNQKDSIESTGIAPLNIRVDFTCNANVPANTTAYCLIIYDRLFSYNALHGDVKQIL